LWISALTKFLLLLLVIASLSTWGAQPEPLETRFQWRQTATNELKQHFRKLIRVTENGGRESTGMLVDVLGSTLRLRRAGQDGGGVLQIRFGDIRSVEVFDAGSK